MITYKGIDYPTKDLTIIIDGEETEITIATDALSVAMGIEKETDGSPEQDIDDEIYFYVLDKEISFSDKDIANNCLDEYFELVIS